MRKFEKRSLLLLFALPLVINACNKNEILNFNTEEIPYSVILIAGQSNTHYGFGFNKNEVENKTRIKQLGRFGDNNMKIIDALSPLDHHTKKKDRIGFGITFAQQLESDFKQSNILIIPCGYEGTGFIDNRWNKDDDLYNDAVNRVRNVLEEFPNSELTAILWHQGEKDVNNPNYKKQLDDFIIDIRNDLNADSIPFILGGLVPYWVKKEKKRIIIQEVIKNTVRRHYNIGFADTEFPFVIDKPDNNFEQKHFSADGQKELGKRYFNEFKRLSN